MRAHPWLSVAVGLLVVSTVIVVWAGTRPSFDAYGWLVWGHQTLHLSLDLGGAPSWKPLPYVFTVPMAVLGHYQLWVWMITCVWVSLAGCVFAGHIAYRIVDHSIRSDDPHRGDGTVTAVDDVRLRRYAALAAGAFSGLALLGLNDTLDKSTYVHYILSAQSDPMLVTFCLAAVDMHVLKRYRWAFAFGVLAALGRPEAWPALAAYSLWGWLKVPSMRWFMCGGWAVILFMWFGIPTITNHRPFISGELAEQSPRELKGNKITGTIHRFAQLQYLPMWIAAIAALVIAFVRRNRTVLFLAVGAAGWVIVEIAFALHGWPGLPRYMFEAGAIAVVLAGVAVGWVLLEAPRLRRGLPRWVGIPVIAVLVGTLVPGAVARIRSEHTDLTHERDRTHELGLLLTTTRLIGGAHRVEYCGEPVTNVEYTSAMAWLYGLNVGWVGGIQQHIEQRQLRNPNFAKVIITPLVHGGWKVLPWHTAASKAAGCRRMKVVFKATHSHPGGALVHY